MNTNRGAATKYSVDEKQVRQCRMKKDELNISVYNNSRAD